MIVEAIIEVLLLPVELLLNGLPSLELPDWLDGFGDESCLSPSTTTGTLGCWAYQVGQYMAETDAWLPTALLFTVMSFVGLLWLAVLTAKGVQKLVSLVTGGGGA